MTPRARPADVRFYFDADVLGLAKVVAGRRSDVTYPGDPGGTVKDTEWIPVAAEAGWLIVTRDSRIQHRRAEVAAVRDAGAKMIALGGTEARGTSHQLEVLLTQWRAIERVAADDGPFIFSALRFGLRGVPLQ